MQTVREIYFEVVDFLSKSGGTYRQMEPSTYWDTIDAIFNNRFRIVRDETGAIIAFTSWWMIHEKDIELVKRGNRPDDMSSGTIVYVADHAGKCARNDLIKFLRDTLGEIDSCWHHRFKQPEQFRYRRKMEAYNAQL